MSTITTRAGKGSALTHNEVDANFTNLNTDKINTSVTLTANYVIKGNGTNTAILSGIYEDGSGNVGVAQTNPSAWLTNGLGIGSGTADWGATIYTGTASSGYLCFADGTTTTDRYRGYLQYSHATDAMVFATAATERLRITSAGSVGIGETAPDYKLDVNGTFGFTPGSSVTPADNGDVVFELTNNTTLTIKAKGSDGTVRSATITLA